MSDETLSPESRRMHELAAALADQLAPGELDELLGQLQPAGDAVRAMILGLGLLLIERSAKATAEYLRQAPLLIGRLTPDEWGPWVGVGLKMAARAAVAAVRYFRESPAMLAEIDPADLRRAVLACADRFAEQEAGLALELVRQAPAVIRVLPDDVVTHRLELLHRWVASGEQLALQERVLASEYFKQSPLVLIHLPATSLADWAELGGTLVQPNRLGKPDYLPALEFFRLSPEWLGALSPPELRSQVLRLVRRVTDESPDRRVQLMRQAPQWLQAVPSAEQRLWLLEQAARLAVPSPGAAVALMERGGELLHRFVLRAPDPFGAQTSWRLRLDEWVQHGTALLARSPETGLAYFRLESEAAEQRLDQVAGGLSLHSMARTLMLFAEGLSGHPVTIKPLTEASPAAGNELPCRQGDTIFLPPFVSGFGSREENFRYYRIVTAYQAAQLEFHAFEVSLEEEAAMAQLAFPLLAKDLWKVAEGGRIDARLRDAYPGLRHDLELVIGYMLYRRPSLAPLSPAEQILELLLQLSMAGRTKEPTPSGLQPLIDELCGLLLRAQRPGATAADSLRAACDCYVLLVRRLTGEMDRAAHRPSSTVQPSADPVGVAGEPLGIRALEDYRELPTPHYRGRQGDAPRGSSADARGPRAISTMGQTDPLATPDDGTDTALPEAAAVTGTAAPAQAGLFHYPEWDEAAQGYRPAWCTVREQRLPQAGEPPGASSSFAEQMRSRYYGQLLMLRRTFERLRPDRFRKLKRQEQGEEIDLEAAVEAMVDRRAGRSPSPKLYQQRDRRERDVAVALLVDISGSTGKHLQGGAR